MGLLSGLWATWQHYPILDARPGFGWPGSMAAAGGSCNAGIVSIVFLLTPATVTRRDLAEFARRPECFSTLIVIVPRTRGGRRIPCPSVIDRTLPCQYMGGDKYSYYVGIDRADLERYLARHAEAMDVSIPVQIQAGVDKMSPSLRQDLEVVTKFQTSFLAA